jgi:hypothetical protein
VDKAFLEIKRAVEGGKLFEKLVGKPSSLGFQRIA